MFEKKQRENPNINLFKGNKQSPTDISVKYEENFPKSKKFKKAKTKEKESVSKITSSKSTINAKQSIDGSLENNSARIQAILEKDMDIGKLTQVLPSHLRSSKAPDLKYKREEPSAMTQ